ncbi:MAG TPA: flagellar hook-basal body complex protein FliE [Acetobacteraceae bacterium]|nr:flagellar hook-basal body complex protein FliE [Acetobacteraceae bacterium]
MSGGIPTLTITPSGVSPGDAASAYARTSEGLGNTQATGQDFGTALDNAVSGAITLGDQAEQASIQGIEGKGDITSVVESVSRAELTLQAATALRDKVVNAYQTIMSMPI